MSTEQHEALKLADACDESAEIWANEIGTRIDAAAMLRTQHALIVQMAEALGKCRFDSLNMKLADFRKICDAHAAATQYLKGPKT